MSSVPIVVESRIGELNEKFNQRIIKKSFLLCDASVGSAAGGDFILIPIPQAQGWAATMHNVHFGYYVFLPTEQAETNIC